MVTWGYAEHGGDNTGSSCQLVEVQDCCSARCTFAAFKGDDSVVIGGQTDAGGDRTVVQEQLADYECLAETKWHLRWFTAGCLVAGLCYGGFRPYTVLSCGVLGSTMVVLAYQRSYFDKAKCRHCYGCLALCVHLSASDVANPRCDQP